MNKKILIFSAVAAIIITLGIYFATRRSAPTQNNQTEQTFTASTGVLQFDPKSQTISIFDPAINRTKKLTSIADSDVIDMATNADQTSLLYSTSSFPPDSVLQVGDNPEAQILNIKSLSGAFADISKANVFSPAWLSPDKIIYQDIPDSGNGDLVIFSVSENQIVNRVSFEPATQSQIHPLNDKTVIVSDFSSDVGDVTSRLVNLDSGEYSDYIAGYGLQFKSVPASKYLAYQTSSKDSAETKTAIIDWSSKEKILELDSSWVSLVGWAANGEKIYYIENSLLKSYDIVSKQTAEISKVALDAISLDITGSKAVISTPSKTTGTNL